MSCYPASPRLVVRRLIWTWGLIRQVVVAFDWTSLNCAIGADLESQGPGRPTAYLLKESQRTWPKWSRVIGPWLYRAQSEVIERVTKHMEDQVLHRETT